ncbi:DUF2267 domain-containing protein [Arthrobacter sp. GCM10027362]|uniref:DUF2267 domain-containing protein n=1 Tax=Arthrobacter sp. GCM10027362 TaxID=3273379 RepID=UPI00363F8451
MKYDEFLAKVQERGDLPGRDESERAVRSALGLLGRRLTGGESDDVASQVPEELMPLLLVSDEPEPIGPEQFLDRLGEDTGADRESARRTAAAVLTTLAEGITEGQLRHILSQLPSGYAEFFGKPEPT